MNKCPINCTARWSMLSSIKIKAMYVLFNSVSPVSNIVTDTQEMPKYVWWLYNERTMPLSDLEVQKKEILLLSGMTQEGFLEDKTFDLKSQGMGYWF